MARHPDNAPDLDTILRRLQPMGRARMVNIFLGEDGSVGISLQRLDNRIASASVKPGQPIMPKMLEVLGPPKGESWADWLGLDDADEADLADFAARAKDRPDEEENYEDLI